MGSLARAMRVGLLLVVAMAAVAARRHEPTAAFTSDDATPPRASRRQLVGYSSTYCIQPSSNDTSNATTILQPDAACWEQQPTNATACTANPNPNSTSSEGCWCADAQCVVHNSPLFNQLAYCARSTTFVAYDGVEWGEWGERRTLCHEQVVLGPDEWTYRPADEPAGLLLNEDAFPFWWLRCAVTPNYQWRTDDAVRWAGTEG